MSKYSDLKSLVNELDGVKVQLETANPSDLMVENLTNCVSEFRATESYLTWTENPPSDNNKVLQKIATKAHEFLSFERVAAMITEANGGKLKNVPTGEEE